MRVRRAERRDIDACIRLDSSYQTQTVWAMDTRWEGKRQLAGFQVRRLPRVLTLQPPLDPDDLHADWRNGDLFLVADEGGVVIGYLDIVSPRRLGTGLVQSIVVRPDLRRRGVGSALCARVSIGPSTIDCKGCAWTCSPVTIPQYSSCRIMVSYTVAIMTAITLPKT